jgi:phage-related protein
MATFPTLPITKITRKTVKPIIRNSYDGGYEQQRLKYTRKIKEFHLSFAVLTQAQTQQLEDFFNTQQGFQFYFYDSVFDTTYAVRFMSDDITFEQSMPNYFSTSLSMREL